VDLGDPRQFERAYRAHSARVTAAARRILGDSAAAEDVAQEVFMRLWQRPELYDVRRGSLAAFLSVMARSRALDRHRAEGAHERARQRLGALNERLYPVEVEPPAAALERTAESEELQRALLKLPAAQRETIALAYGRELNSREIAGLMHVGRATARSRLRLGIGKLRAELGATQRAA
jgi:RNA polymerase sigma-70 factor (ECF subfamily)